MNLLQLFTGVNAGYGGQRRNRLWLLGCWAEDVGTRSSIFSPVVVSIPSFIPQEFLLQCVLFSVYCNCSDQASWPVYCNRNILQKHSINWRKSVSIFDWTYSIGNDGISTITSSSFRHPFGHLFMGNSCPLYKVRLETTLWEFGCPEY